MKKTNVLILKTISQALKDICTIFDEEIIEKTENNPEEGMFRVWSKNEALLKKHGFEPVSKEDR